MDVEIVNLEPSLTRFHADLCLPEGNRRHPMNNFQAKMLRRKVEILHSVPAFRMTNVLYIGAHCHADDRKHLT